VFSGGRWTDSLRLAASGEMQRASEGLQCACEFGLPFAVRPIGSSRASWASPKLRPRGMKMQSWHLCCIFGCILGCISGQEVALGRSGRAPPALLLRRLGASRAVRLLRQPLAPSSPSLASLVSLASLASEVQRCKEQLGGERESRVEEWSFQRGKRLAQRRQPPSGTGRVGAGPSVDASPVDSAATAQGQWSVDAATARRPFTDRRPVDGQ